MTTAQAQNMNQVKEGDKIISSVAMIVTLVSFGMLFLTLMMAFALYRFTAPVWPPAGMEKPSLLLPGFSTALIFISSIFFHKFETALTKNIVNKSYLLITIMTGSAFMASQVLFWNELKSHGIYVSSGVFPSIIYAFTWIHAAHIVAGLGLLVWLYDGLKNPTAMTPIKASNVGKFWHFLGVVWLIMFVTIFVL